MRLLRRFSCIIFLLVLLFFIPRSVLLGQQEWIAISLHVQGSSVASRLLINKIFVAYSYAGTKEVILFETEKQALSVKKRNKPEPHPPILLAI